MLASPGDRLPGTFDQDVYVELMRRFQEAGEPPDGALSFTLHAFCARSAATSTDGPTNSFVAHSPGSSAPCCSPSAAISTPAVSEMADVRFTLLSSVMIERRRSVERDQLALFPAMVAAEPGEARVVISPIVRQNVQARHVVQLECGSLPLASLPGRPAPLPADRSRSRRGRPRVACLSRPAP